MKYTCPQASTGGRSKRPKPAPVKLLIGARRPNPLWRLGSWLLICGTATIAVLTIGAVLQLMVDPYSENWLKAVFPTLNPTESAPLQTLDEIRANLRQDGLIPGKPILWHDPRVARQPRSEETADWIFPIQSTRANCKNSCTSITELYIYRPQLDTSPQKTQDLRYRLVQQVRLQGPKESFVTLPLVDTASEVASVDQPAPLTHLSLFETPFTDRPWLLLEGTKTFGNSDIRYGQLLHYNPRSTAIQTLVTWTSPTGQPPTFKVLAEAGPAELLINQTVGLEPQWQTFEVLPTDPPKLKEISLLNSVFDRPPKTSLYQKALRLAQSGVWSHAQQMMESARSEIGTNWPSEAEAQLRLIVTHAEQSQAQAQQIWSSRQQQLQAYLIDGQWENALKILEENPGYYDIINPLLKRHFERTWKRVQAHLQIHPKDTSAQLWGALLISARQNPESGKQWLAEQSTERSENSPVLNKLETILNPPAIATIPSYPPGQTAQSPDHLNGSPSDKLNPTPSAQNSAPTRYQRLLGSAQQMNTPGTNWLSPSANLPTLGPNQTWYSINLLSLYDNNGWHLAHQVDFSSIDNTVEHLWPWMGLNINNSLQLVAWNTVGQANAVSIQVVGLQRQGSGIRLLGIGPALEEPGLPTRSPLAMTSNSVQWLNNTTGVPLNVLLQTPAGWHQSLPAQLETALGLPSTPTSSGIHPTILALAPFWQTYYLDLTGDTTPELFLTLNPNTVPDSLVQALPLNNGWQRTLIFNAAGELLYNDFNNAQNHVVAVVPGSPAQPTAILTYQEPNYGLRYFGR